MPLEDDGNPKVLILGASGYVGSFLVEFFQEKNWNVTSSSRSGVIERSGINHVNFLELSTAQRRGILSSIDFVINCAGSTARSAESDRQAALLGDLSVIESVIYAQPLPKQLVIVNMSSIRVYGDYHFPTSISETSKLMAKSNYGMNKIEIEKFLIESAQKFNIKYFNLRISNLFGSAGRLCKSLEAEKLVVNTFVKTAVEDGTIKIISSPRQTRDFVSLGNFGCALYQMLANFEEIESGSYNICSGIQTSLHSLALLIASGVSKIFERDVEIISDNDKYFERSLKLGGIFSQKKLNQLGIVIPHTLESAIFELIKSYEK